MVSKISQSFIKDAVDYFSGDLCGNLMREKWVNDRLLDLDSESVALGSYFEYYFTLITTGTGSLPKNGKVPERGMYANGKQPLAKYALAEMNARRLKEYFDLMGFKIIRAGTTLTKGRFVGQIDLMVECEKDLELESVSLKIGDVIVIDLKYSGLIENRWERFGWAGMLTPGPHIQKDYNGIQAKQYHYVSGFPFFFLVVSSSNENDVLLLHVPVSEQMEADHIIGGNVLLDKFKFEATMGFVARPDISVCNKCPLRGECRDKHTFPHPKTVEL